MKNKYKIFYREDNWFKFPCWVGIGPFNWFS